MVNSTCFLCGRNGQMELHHVFPGALRDKSTQYGFLVPLCGDTCHRLGKKSAHCCRETSDSLKAHFQTIYMIRHKASVEEWRTEFHKNYIDLTKIENEKEYPMNIVALSGRLTADPELRHTGDGTPVTSFRIAVKRPGTSDKTDFINCVAWRKTAEFISQYFTKGRRIEISGYLKNDPYEREGVTIHRDAVEIERAFFGDDKKREDRQETETDTPSKETFQELAGNENGELPF